MVKVKSKALNQSLEVGRIIGHIKGAQPGPCIVFFGGIHGNEPAGIFALHSVLEQIRAKQLSVSGNIYAISGNLWALERGQRFHQQDLNRLWTHENMEKILAGTLESHNEDIAQQIEIFEVVRNILDTEEGPFYFIDLHTTSSETCPFFTVNDSLLNRKFTQQYPVPMILGIEEYLEGPLLSYLNALGYVSFGFEGGQHDALSSIESMVSFIYLSLVFTANLQKEAIDFDWHYQFLHQLSEGAWGIYEIFLRYEIQEGEAFRMEAGYQNFQEVTKGENLAVSGSKQIQASRDGKIFMPLYQKQGEDGFFLIRRTPAFFLRLSALLRKMRFDRILPWLPGVSWMSEKHDRLSVNRKVARFFTKPFFHLMGYRSQYVSENRLIMHNREEASRTQDYQQAVWLHP